MVNIDLLGQQNYESDIAERLKHLREEQGLTQAQLAELVGVDFRTVSIWERGIRLPKDEFSIELGSVLGVEMTYLFGLTDSREETRLSDEEAAAVVEAEEQEITDWMVQRYKKLSLESQRVVRIMINALLKADRDAGVLQISDSTKE